MYSRVPVVACASGGPLETVANEKTGFLCDNNADSFAQCISLVVMMGPAGRAQMGAKGHQWVNEKFSFNAFSEKIATTYIYIF